MSVDVFTDPTLDGLRQYLDETRKFNFTWIELHVRDGHPAAADRRRKIVETLDAWVGLVSDPAPERTEGEG